MRTRLLFLASLLLLSSCVSKTYRGGKEIDPPQEPSQFATAKAPAPSASQLSTDARVDLVPRKDNPELYEYRVTEVFPKTVFARAGIKSGDTLLSIDGKPIQTMADAISLPHRIGTGEFNKILIRRNGKNVLLQAKK